MFDDTGPWPPPKHPYKGLEELPEWRKKMKELGKKQLQPTQQKKFNADVYGGINVDKIITKIGGKNAK